MKGIRMELVAFACVAALAVPASMGAQTRSDAAAFAATLTSELTVQPQVELENWGRSAVRIGQDYALGAGDANREVVVIMGAATIEGHVNGDVRVVFGQARLSSTAVIEGSLVVVGGSATAASGAVVRRDVVVIGGGFDAPPEFVPEGGSIVIGARSLGGRLQAIVPWITRGLLWGRPIVPNLPWVWGIVGIFFLVYLALNLVLDEPARACAETLAGRPLTALMVGLLVLLLTGPVCLLLAVSVIGLAVVPFVFCALFVAAIVGKIGVARWIGMSVLRQPSQEGHLRSLGSFVAGFAVLCVAYMIPVLGIVAWTMVGVFGLGAATVAFIAAYRRENPALPPRPPQTLHPDEGVSSFSAEAPEPPASPAVAPPPPAVSDLASLPRASFRVRLAAAVLDLILVLIASQLLDIFRHDRDSAIFLLLLIYHVGFWTWKGATVGGIICQLRVVRVDGAPLRFVDALVRGLSSIFSLAVLGLGFLWILRDPERQAWHDRIAGTYVVRVPRNWPL